MKTVQSKTGLPSRRTTALAAAAALLGACANYEPISHLPDIPVTVTFDESHCPIKVDPDNPTVDKASNQRLVWQAVDGVGTPIPEVFSIYFDPFKGRPLTATSKGDRKSPPFDPDTPANVEYKYTVVGKRCPDKPRDPRFFLN